MKDKLRLVRVVKVEKVSEPDPKDPNSSITKLNDLKEVRQTKLLPEHIKALNAQSANSLFRYEEIEEEKPLSRMTTAELEAKVKEKGKEFPDDVKTNKDRVKFLEEL